MTANRHTDLGRAASRRTASRRAATILGAALVSAGLTVTAGIAPARAADPPPRPVLVCEPGVCVLDASGWDSDGDGWSDADETSTGYDPHDPASHPSVLQMIGVWVRGEVRPDGFGLREVVVLPETAPDGTSLVSSAAITGVGHQRKDAMTRLGLTNDRLKGLDTSNGLRAVLDLGGAKSSAGTLPVFVGGVDISTISTVMVTSTGSKDGSAYAFWSNSKGSGRMTLDAPTVDADGTTHTTIGVETRTDSERNGVKSTTSTSTTTVGTSSPGGSMSSVTVSQSETRNGEGKVVSTSSSTTTTSVDENGLKSVVVESERTDSTGTTTYSTTVTVTDKNGKVLEQTCNGDPCKGMSSGEIDPTPQYVPGQVVVATPELSRALEVRFGGYTRKGETPVLDSDSTPSWPLYSRQNPGTILVDPNNDMVWGVDLSAVPDYDKFGGNVTFAPGVNHPDPKCIPSTSTPCPA